jgi:hypothetical protein
MSTVNNCICGKVGDKRCTKCRLVCYCSRECQSADFPKHKKICQVPSSNVTTCTTEVTCLREAYIKCVCGKRANNKCGKCLMVSYCSRECQIADFPIHKQLCKRLKEDAIPTIGERSWREIMRLPEECHRNPLPRLPPSCPRLPLEELLPFFLLLFTIKHQCGVVICISPVHTVLENDNKLSVLTLNIDEAKIAGLQSFTSFKTFTGNKLPQNSHDMQIWKTAFLHFSFMSKCTQIVSCFGLLILSAVTSHQLT